jgi:hypothetical protein
MTKKGGGDGDEPREPGTPPSPEAEMEEAEASPSGQGFRQGTWMAYTDDDTGFIYYHCETTGETLWERPGGDAVVIDGDALLAGAGEGVAGQDGEGVSGFDSCEEYADSDSSSEAGDGDGDGDDDGDDDGHHAASTGHEGQGLRGGRYDDNDDDGQGGLDGGDGELPDGWEALYDDETGFPYYYHEASETVQWVRPGDEGLYQEVAEHDAALQGGGGSKAQVAEHTHTRESVTSPISMAEPSEREVGAAEGELKQLKDFMSKLVLGGDFSGGSGGDHPALTVSHAITNLAVASFGSMHRLEPMPQAAKARWLKEIEWLLLPVQHIVIMRPIAKVLPDGSHVEVMQQQQREDIARMLPALRGIDERLTMIQARFTSGDLEVAWHKQDKGSSSSSGKKPAGEAWWQDMPVVETPVSESFANSILKCLSVAERAQKEARSINDGVIISMPTPERYLKALPGNASQVLGKDTAKLLKKKEGFVRGDFMRKLSVADSHGAQSVIGKFQDAALIWSKKKADAQDSFHFTFNSDEVDRGIRRCLELAKFFRFAPPNLPQPAPTCAPLKTWPRKFAPACPILYPSVVGHCPAACIPISGPLVGSVHHGIGIESIPALLLSTQGCLARCTADAARDCQDSGEPGCGPCCPRSIFSRARGPCQQHRNAPPRRLCRRCHTGAVLVSSKCGRSRSSLEPRLLDGYKK